MENNHYSGPVVRPYAEGLTTLQVVFSVQILYVSPYKV